MQQSSALPIPADTDSEFKPAHPFAGLTRPARVSVEVLKARVRRYNSDLEPTSETFGAALILIAGAEYGQNIDVLARRTGHPRAFVARCARRLIDNGVWHGGRTVAEWAARDPASGSFWNDVAVAEGKMCRRARPDGSLEWAPAGFWNKNFQFLDPDAEDRLGNHYLDSAPEAPGPEPESTPGDDTSSARPDSGSASIGNGTAGALDALGEGVKELALPQDETDFDTPDQAGQEGPDVGEPAPDLQDPVPSLHHVFRDAVWLG